MTAFLVGLIVLALMLYVVMLIAAAAAFGWILICVTTLSPAKRRKHRPKKLGA